MSESEAARLERLIEEGCREWLREREMQAQERQRLGVAEQRTTRITICVEGRRS